MCDLPFYFKEIKIKHNYLPNNVLNMKMGFILSREGRKCRTCLVYKNNKVQVFFNHEKYYS